MQEVACLGRGGQGADDVEKGAADEDRVGAQRRRLKAEPGERREIELVDPAGGHGRPWPGKNGGHLGGWSGRGGLDERLRRNCQPDSEANKRAPRTQRMRSRLGSGVHARTGIGG